MWFKTLLVFCLVCISFNIAGQVKQNKSAKPKKTNALVKPWMWKERSSWSKADNLEYIKDSTASARQWIRDSIRMDQEMEKERIYREKYYENRLNPTDSLSFVDRKVEKIISASLIYDINVAIKIIQKNFKTSFQKTRAVFYWIARTVRYDNESFRNNSVQAIVNADMDAKTTFFTRKGVCQNYANLFRYMLTQLSVEVAAIRGYGKNYPYGIVQGKDSDHAWNAVKLNNQWRLFDVTWAGVSADKVDNYWFNVSPRQFIYNHFPVDSNWQLLETKINVEAFKNFPIVDEYFFKSKAAVTIPSNGFISGRSDIFPLELTKETRKYDLSFSIMPYKGDDWRKFSEERKGEEMKTDVKKNVAKDYCLYEAIIPRKGTWWIIVSVAEKTGDKICPDIDYPNCLYFKVTYY